MMPRTKAVIASSGQPSMMSWQGVQAKQTSSSSPGAMFRRFFEWAKERALSFQQPGYPISQVVIPARLNRVFRLARQASHAFVFLPARFIGFFAVKTVFRSIDFLAGRHGFFARRGVFLVRVLFQPISYDPPAFHCAELLRSSWESWLSQAGLLPC